MTPLHPQPRPVRGCRASDFQWSLPTVPETLTRPGHLWSIIRVQNVFRPATIMPGLLSWGHWRLLRARTGERTLAHLAANSATALRERLAMRPAQWALLAQRLPRIADEHAIGEDARANAAVVVDYLFEQVGMDAPRARALVLGAPRILTFARAKLEHRLGYWQARLELSDADVRRLLAAYPQALLLRSRTNVGPTLDALAERFELDLAALRVLVLRWPPVVGMSLPEGLHPRLEYVRERLELDEAQLRRLFLMRPRLFGSAIHENIEPKLALLERELCVSGAELRKIATRAPTLLGLSTDTLLARLRSIREALGLEPEQLRKMVLLFPSVACYSPEAKLAPTVRFLRERLSLNSDEMAAMLRVKPQLVSYALANLQAKLAFFEEEVGASPEQVRTAVLAAPAILGLSIANRLRPRLQLLQAQLAQAAAEGKAAPPDVMLRFRLAAVRPPSGGRAKHVPGEVAVSV